MWPLERGRSTISMHSTLNSLSYSTITAISKFPPLPRTVLTHKHGLCQKPENSEHAFRGMFLPCGSASWNKWYPVLIIIIVFAKHKKRQESIHSTLILLYGVQQEVPTVSHIGFKRAVEDVPEVNTGCSEWFHNKHWSNGIHGCSCGGSPAEYLTIALANLTVFNGFVSASCIRMCSIFWLVVRCWCFKGPFQRNQSSCLQIYISNCFRLYSRMWELKQYSSLLEPT